MKPVLVIWHDAHAGSSRWEHLDDLEDDGHYEVKSIGYLLKVRRGGKKGHVSLAQSLGGEECVDSILHIPVKMVKQIIELSEVPNASTPNNDNDSTRVPKESDSKR
jgi:hypothetical protein